LDQHSLPPYFKLEPGRPVSGWIAISLRSRESKEGYHWLKAFQPEARIGHSIDLYFIKLSDLPVADRAKAKMTKALSVRHSLGNTKPAVELSKTLAISA